MFQVTGNFSKPLPLLLFVMDYFRLMSFARVETVMNVTKQQKCGISHDVFSKGQEEEPVALHSLTE